MPRNINNRTAGNINPETSFFQKCKKEPPFWPYPHQLTRLRRETAKRTKLCTGTRKIRVPQAPGGDDESVLHAPPKEGKSSPAPDGCRTPYKMGSTLPEAGAPPAGVHRRWTESMRLPAPPLAFSPCVLLITRDGLPLFLLSFLLSLRSLLSHYSHLAPLVPAAFFLFLGTSGSPGGDVCTHLPHMAMPTPIHLLCAHALDSSLCLTCFLSAYLTVSAGLACGFSQVASWSWVLVWGIVRFLCCCYDRLAPVNANFIPATGTRWFD